MLSTDAHLIVWASKMNQDVYYKGILTSEFGTKDMMIWKRGSSFVFTEDVILWIASRPIQYDRPCPFESWL